MGPPLEPAGKDPKPDQHDESVGVMQQFRFDQLGNGIPARRAFRDRPVEGIDLEAWARCSAQRARTIAVNTRSSCFGPFAIKREDEAVARG